MNSSSLQTAPTARHFIIILYEISNSQTSKIISVTGKRSVRLKITFKKKEIVDFKGKVTICALSLNCL